MPGVEVGAHAVGPPADLVPGMRRHVVDVAGPRNPVAEMLRAGGCEAGIDGRLGGVDIEMAGARMADVAVEHAREHPVQPLHVGIGEVTQPAARLEQEQRVRVERHRVQVVRVLLGQPAHGLGVRFVLLAARLRIEVLDVAVRHRLDVRSLLRARAVHPRRRLLDRGVGMRRLERPHRAVQVRTPRPRLAPVADGALRIAFPRLAERPGRFLLGEGVHQREALVEVRLRLGVGG